MPHRQPACTHLQSFTKALNKKIKNKKKDPQNDLKILTGGNVMNGHMLSIMWRSLQKNHFTRRQSILVHPRFQIPRRILFLAHNNSTTTLLLIILPRISHQSLGTGSVAQIPLAKGSKRNGPFREVAERGWNPRVNSERDNEFIV